MWKNRMKLLVAAMLFIFCLQPLIVNASEGDDMENVLHLYSQKKYSQAKRCNKKMKFYANEDCVKKMNPKMKQAYKKQVTTYAKQVTDNRSNWALADFSYYLTDIDNDNKADLLIYYGTDSSHMNLSVYQYKGNKVVKEVDKSVQDSVFYAYPDHKGIVRIMKLVNGCEYISILTLDGEKLAEEAVGKGKSINDRFPMHQVLNDHTCFDKNNKPYVDLSVFK